MSRASCHFSTCTTSSGIRQAARRATWSAAAFGEAGSQDRGATAAADRTAISIVQARRARTWAGSHGPVVMKWARAWRLPSSPSRAGQQSVRSHTPSTHHHTRMTHLTKITVTGRAPQDIQEERPKVPGVSAGREKDRSSEHPDGLDSSARPGPRQRSAEPPGRTLSAHVYSEATSNDLAQEHAWPDRMELDKHRPVADIFG